MWICQCDCGRQKKRPTDTYSLRSGKVRSCGCLYHVCNTQNSRKHGMYGTRINHIWSSMKGRCRRNDRYRNISVCEDWLSFDNFYNWAMSNGYQDDLTLDRIDNNGDYTPENCRWVSYKVQENNKSNNRHVVYQGDDYTLAELASHLGVSHATLAWRINNGWPQSDWSIPVNLANRVIRRKL